MGQSCSIKCTPCVSKKEKKKIMQWEFTLKSALDSTRNLAFKTLCATGYV